MPLKPKKNCNKPGCGKLTRTAYCEAHQGEVKARHRQRDKYRGTAAQRGYGTRWRKARAAYLAANPLCVKCSRVTPASVVDHVIPHRGDQALFWDQENWQALCKPCHDRKTGSGL